MFGVNGVRERCGGKASCMTTGAQSLVLAATSLQIQALTPKLADWGAPP